MNEKIVAAFQELKDNQVFQQRLENAGSPEEIQEILKDYDVDMSIEEVQKMIQETAGELSEDDLADVAGGCRFPNLVGFKVIWVPIILWGRIVYVPKLVPVYCKCNKR